MDAQYEWVIIVLKKMRLCLATEIESDFSLAQLAISEERCPKTINAAS